MKDISDRKSWGAEWCPTAGLKFRLYNRKGSTSLDFQIIRQGRSMVNDTVDTPRRFGLNTPPESYAEFAAVAGDYARQVEISTERARTNTVIHRADGGTRRPDVDTPRQRLFCGIF